MIPKYGIWNSSKFTLKLLQSWDTLLQSYKPKSLRGKTGKEAGRKNRIKDWVLWGQPQEEDSKKKENL